MARGPADPLFPKPHSATTWGLLPPLPPGQPATPRRVYQTPGHPPHLLAAPKGDPFAPRNEFATARCFEEVPPLRQVEDSVPGHLVAAWYDLPALLAKREGAQA